MKTTTTETSEEGNQEIDNTSRKITLKDERTVVYQCLQLGQASRYSI